MRKTILSAVAVLGLSSVASANWGTPPTPAPQPAPTNMYGWNKKLLWWKKADTCAGGNCGGAQAGYGQQMPGTLVFPQHQFIRSPRDYFMYEGK